MGGGGGILGAVLTVVSFFVPAIAPFVQAFNVINSIATGNPMGAIMGGIGLLNGGGLFGSSGFGTPMDGSMNSLSSFDDATFGPGTGQATVGGGDVSYNGGSALTEVPNNFIQNPSSVLDSSVSPGSNLVSDTGEQFFKPNYNVGDNTFDSLKDLYGKGLTQDIVNSTTSAGGAIPNVAAQSYLADPNVGIRSQFINSGYDPTAIDYDLARSNALGGVQDVFKAGSVTGVNDYIKQLSEGLDTAGKGWSKSFAAAADANTTNNIFQTEVKPSLNTFTQGGGVGAPGTLGNDAGSGSLSGLSAGDSSLTTTGTPTQQIDPDITKNFGADTTGGGSRSVQLEGVDTIGSGSNDSLMDTINESQTGNQLKYNSPEGTMEKLFKPLSKGFQYGQPQMSYDPSLGPVGPQASFPENTGFGGQTTNLTANDVLSGGNIMNRGFSGGLEDFIKRMGQPKPMNWWEAGAKGLGALDSWSQNRKAMDTMRDSIESVRNYKDPNADRYAFANQLYMNQAGNPMAGAEDVGVKDAMAAASRKAAQAGQRGNFFTSGGAATSLADAHKRAWMDRIRGAQMGFGNVPNNNYAAASLSAPYAAMQRNANAPFFDAFTNIARSGVKGVFGDEENNNTSGY